MTSLLLDLVLYILLFASLGFGAISIVGLWLFPDLRCREFTGIRAAVLSLCAMVLAGMIFGLNALLVRGGDQYLMLVILSVVMLVVIIAGNLYTGGLIIRQSVPVSCNTLCGDAKPEQPPETDTK